MTDEIKNEDVLPWVKKKGEPESYSVQADHPGEVVVGARLSDSLAKALNERDDENRRLQKALSERDDFCAQLAACMVERDNAINERKTFKGLSAALENENARITRSLEDARREIDALMRRLSRVREPDLIAADAPGLVQEHADQGPPYVSVLQEAEDAVNQRMQSYGTPEKNFELIAAFWAQYLTAIGWTQGQRAFTCRDVSFLMVLVKIARDVTGKPKRDNLVDIAGFVRCADLVADGESRSSSKQLLTPLDEGAP